MALLLTGSLSLTPVLSSTVLALEADSSLNLETKNGEAEKIEEIYENDNSSVSGSDDVLAEKDEEIPSISGSDIIIIEDELQEESVSEFDAIEMMELPCLAAGIYDDQLDFDTYNESIYRAERYLAADSVSYKNISSMMEIGIPSDIIVNIGKDDWGFMSSAAAWKVANMVVSPSQIAEGAIDEVGFYEAIIFSIFIEQSKDTNYLYRLINETNSETNKIVSQIEKWIKETDALDQKVDVSTGMLKNLSEKDKEELKKELEIIFIEEHPLLDGVSEIGGMLSTVFDFSDTLIDAIETMTAYMQLSELPQEMKMVISYMYEECPDDNLYLKQALQEASDATGSLASAFSVSVLHTADDLTVDVAGGMIDDWWESVLSKNKYSLAYLNGAKLGKFISNTLFSTDKTIEQFEKMVCLQDVYELLKDVTISSGETFEHARTVENADIYIAAVDALYKSGELSCDFAMNFEEVYYTETIAALKLLWENDSYENYMQKLKNLKSYYINNKQILTKSYLNDLEADYPELYAQLYGSYEDKYVAVEGIQFPQDEITIGTQDVYACFEIPTISPSNATKQNVTYVSSDTSILEVSGPVVMLTPHKPGTVTVTVSTEDGGYTDTILVHIVEGKVADLQNWGVPRVMWSGEWGDDIGYVVYENGLMVISGSGEMWADPNYAFLRDEIKEVIVQNGITSIGDGAFSGCSNLATIEVPSSVTSIGNGVFSGCSNLATIEVPSSVTKIGDGAFNGCSVLYSIEIPFGVTDIGNDVFSGCNSLSSIEIPPNIVNIGDNAFSECSNLSSIEIPSSVVSIGISAFSHCCSLSSIVIPSNIISIGDNAFEDCINLNTVKIYGHQANVGSKAFLDCKNLTCAELLGVASIGDYAFENCNNLKTIKISNDLLFIGESAFQECESLINVELEDEGQVSNDSLNVGLSAFGHCSNLKSVELPGKVSIGQWAFINCSNLESIVLQNGAEEIGKESFRGCCKLQSITLSNSAKAIGEDAFYDCSSLIFIESKDGGNSNILTNIAWNAFHYCDNLISVALPGKTAVQGHAFWGCSSLKEIKTVGGLSYIGDYAFYKCDNLSEIELSSDLTYIGSGAFTECKKLKDVYYQGNEEKWNDIEIGNYNGFLTNATIHYNSVTVPTAVPTKVDPVKFTVAGVIGGRNVTFSTDTEGAIIYYSSKTSNLTTEDAYVKNGETVLFEDFYGTIYARAYVNGQWGNVSRLILKIPVVSKPVISSDNGVVTIKTSTPNSTIYYTTDGSTPSPTNGKRLTNSAGSFTVPGGCTVKAIAVRSCFTNSEIASAAVTAKKLGAPSFAVKGVIGGRAVTFNTAEEQGEIYYSFTTSNITTKDLHVKPGETVLFENYYGTVYAKTYVNGQWSNVSRLILKIPVVNTPTITDAGNGRVKISTSTPNCTIYYTTDGSTPSPTHGMRINSSSSIITVGSGKTVKAIAVRSCFTNSSVASYK